MSNAIKVAYKFVDGAHFFVSTDKEAAGLCVANTDMETAFNEVSAQLNALWAFNHGKAGNFQPMVLFDSFKKTLEALQVVAKLGDQSGMIVPGPIQPWMMAVEMSGRRLE
jgi:hypothetical protein